MLKFVDSRRGSCWQMLAFAELSFRNSGAAARLVVGLHGLGGDRGDRISGAYEGKTDGATRSCASAVQPFSLKTGKPAQKRAQPEKT
jgi:hypothetical protein